jgi:hypothetical protein
MPGNELFLSRQATFSCEYRLVFLHGVLFLPLPIRNTDKKGILFCYRKD